MPRGMILEDAVNIEGRWYWVRVRVDVRTIARTWAGLLVRSGRTSGKAGEGITVTVRPEPARKDGE